MNLKRLEHHIKLCRRNLASSRVKCCAACPFEEEIVAQYPDLAVMFERKRDRFPEMRLR